jgi:AcrR family transcriptional regulator
MSPRRAPLTRRGEQTYQQLLNSAENAFYRYGYYRTSIARICRLSRVANGTFYQYFPNKEAIFVALVKRLTHTLDQALAQGFSDNGSVVAQITSLVRAYLFCLQKHRRLYQVFREAEFIRLELSQDFYRRLAARFMSVLLDGMRRGEVHQGDPEIIAYCLVGLQEFLALQYVIWQEALTESVLTAAYRFLNHGIDSRRKASKAIVKLPKARLSLPSSLISGEETRSRLLQAAEVEFGLRGYYKTSVADIARRAGVALGTVYVHFHSKEELFVELIHEINHGLRRASAAGFADLRDRREIERAGFQAFFEFIGRHRQAYGIVREAEFVNGQSGRWYYQSLGKPYAAGLAEGMRRGEIVSMPEEPLAYQLMGIGHFLGLRWLIWPHFCDAPDTLPPRLPKRVFTEAMRFILCGLTR